jgi:hypothetical protein
VSLESIAFLGPDSNYTALNTPVFPVPTGIPDNAVSGDSGDPAPTGTPDASSLPVLTVVEEWTILSADAINVLGAVPSPPGTSSSTSIASGDQSGAHPLDDYHGPVGHGDSWRPVKCRECRTINYPLPRKDWYAVIAGIEIGAYHR